MGTGTEINSGKVGNIKNNFVRQSVMKDFLSGWYSMIMESLTPHTILRTVKYSILRFFLCMYWQIISNLDVN